MADIEKPDYTTLTVQLLSAYVANNPVPSNELATLIQSTRSALIAETAPPEVETPEFSPAVSVRKSLASRDHIISLIDGRPYKTLKRHLATHGLTPDEYRERFGLAKTYPMVAPSYSERRRAVAQKIGLGQRGSATKVVTPPSTTNDTASAKVTGRKKQGKSEAKVTAPRSIASARATKAKQQPSEPQPVITAAVPRAPKKSKPEAEKPPVSTGKASPKVKSAGAPIDTHEKGAKPRSPKVRAAAQGKTETSVAATGTSKPVRRKLGIKTTKSKTAAASNG
ncbi:MucR family transcriptional regulator [Sphingobium sp. BYY-5]|uniref:MucR family transcriptional regulator n=1 Tax=Sphingobium sp. BYY-5 TaxID=2926400 RepID=UPI001FA7DBE6|nr:MucR family transcriptional regulator [Sphingobium sp. BYY-5]MCI4591964.1 MucR family transcriptional regulator [Sphingobium sp. BYY-5]